MDPTPSAPSAPAAPAADHGDSLRAELGAAIAAAGLKDVPSGDTPESTSGGEATPAAPAPGTTPAAAPLTPGKQLAEGSTPAGDSQPAVESEAADLKRALEMVGLEPAVADSLSPEQRQHFLKLGKAFLDTNNRAGALGRKLKALEKGKTPEEILLDGDPADPADEPPLEDPEDPDAGIVAEEAAPPSLSDPRVVEAVEKRVDQIAAEDADCIAVSQQYHHLGKTIAAIATQDQATGAWSGVLPDIDRELQRTEKQIDYLNASLDPEAATRYGLPALDEITAGEVRQRLIEARSQAADLRSRRAEFVDRYRELRSQRNDLRGQYAQRRDAVRQHIVGQVSARQREADNQKALKRDADKYRGEWKSTFDTLTSTLIPEAYRADADLKKDLWEAVKQAGLVQVEAHGTIPNFSEFQTQVIKRELERLDRHHRLRSADYGRQKLADATTPTPTGPGATAAPLPTDTVDHEDALRQQTRGLFARRAG